ncbi:MAG: YbaK/EbsC family protein [Candidatus Omnitrophica bacterium]|nr:YbaK/EbsC family protein [Candidatus Omnitrophota bacterium]
MSVSIKLKDLLDKNRIKYKAMVHSRVITAQEVAQVEHIPGRDLAKTVVIRKGKEYFLFVLPAPKQVDFSEVRKLFNSHDVALATEAEFRGLFPDSELGAMPPFGVIYGIKTYVDDSLKSEKEIAFNAGTHTDTILMSREDYEKVVKPDYIKFAA